MFSWKNKKINCHLLSDGCSIEERGSLKSLNIYGETIMKKMTILGALLLVAILIPALCLAQAEKIFSQHNKAVVVVMTYDGANKGISQGSGFIVRQDGVIVTNYHVISDAKSIKIKAANKVFNVDYIIDLDKENDIAILKVNASNMPIVILGDFRKTKIGEKIYVISSPKGLENTISDGILSGKREDEDDKTILQITAPISPGSSGGPVFNQNGQVIGVATFLLKESQNLNFAMPVDGIKDKITTKKVAAIKSKQIENYSKTSEYWYNLGIIYGKSGKLQEAMDAFKEAIHIKPDYAEAHNGLGSAYWKSGYAEAHRGPGSAYGKSGKLQEAVDAFKEAIRIKPDYAEAHTNLGTAYSQSGKYQEAIESFKEAIRIKPDNAVAHYNLGLTYVRLKDRNSALSEYGILKNLDPERAKKLFDLISN
jgi:Flp pilus assembly protein TadD